MSQPSTAGPEVLAGAALLGIGGVGGVVWGGAQSAALAASGRPLPATLGDALEALPRLMKTPGHPAAAWPADAARLLPGPVEYWTATAAVTGLLLLLVTGLARWLWRDRVGLTRRRRLGIDPEGRFATGWDLLPLWVRRAVPGRMVLGIIRPDRTGRAGLRLPGRSRAGRLVATESPQAGLDRAVPALLRPWARHRAGQRGSVIVLGPSQCGKTAALAIPAILEWDGPVIALSVKADLMGATIARRRQVGQVRIFDPAGATSERSDTWSPLREAASLAGARRSARSLANATSWTQTSGDMAFWTEAGEDLLAGLFWLAAHVGVGIDAVVRWVQTMDKTTPRTLLAGLASHVERAVAAEAALVLEAFDGIWRSDAKQISSVYLTARAMVRPWQEPTVAASAATGQPHNDGTDGGGGSSGSDGRGIDLGWLLGRGHPPGADPAMTSSVSSPVSSAVNPAGSPSAGAERPTGANTLYLCADLDEAERLAPVLGGLVDDLFKQAYARVSRTNQPLDPPLLIVIDEAGNWPLRSLPGRISTCAGLGIQLMLVFQSKAQIDAAYATRSDVVISNAITKVFFAGLSDESTLRYAAHLVGDEHVTASSTSADVSGLAGIGDPAGGGGIGGLGGGRFSLSRQPNRLEMLPPSVLRQVRPGQALLIHNTLRPAHLHGRYWFLEPDLYQLATGERATRRALARRARQRTSAPAANSTAGGGGSRVLRRTAAGVETAPGRVPVGDVDSSDADEPATGTAVAGSGDAGWHRIPRPGRRAGSADSDVGRSR